MRLNIHTTAVVGASPFQCHHERRREPTRVAMWSSYAVNRGAFTCVQSKPLLTALPAEAAVRSLIAAGAAIQDDIARETFMRPASR